MEPQTRQYETMMLIIPICVLVFLGIAVFGGPGPMLSAIDAFLHQLFLTVRHFISQFV